MTPVARGMAHSFYNLFGFKAKGHPQEGWGRFEHPQSGLEFELGPVNEADSELGLGDDQVLSYKPIRLGSAMLPSYMQVGRGLGFYT